MCFLVDLQRAHDNPAAELAMRKTKPGPEFDAAWLQEWECGMRDLAVRYECILPAGAV